MLSLMILWQWPDSLINTTANQSCKSLASQGSKEKIDIYGPFFLLLMKIHHCCSDPFFFFAVQINSFQAIVNYSSSVLFSCLWIFELIKQNAFPIHVLFSCLGYIMCFTACPVGICSYAVTEKHINYFFLHYAIYLKTLFLLQSKIIHRKVYFLCSFPCDDLRCCPHENIISYFCMCENLSSCVVHTLKYFNHSSDCSLYHFHKYFYSIAFVGNRTYISNLSFLGGGVCRWKSWFPLL